MRFPHPDSHTRFDTATKVAATQHSRRIVDSANENTPKPRLGVPPNIDKKEAVGQALRS